MYSASIKIRREEGRKVGTGTGDKSLGFLPSVQKCKERQGKNISGEVYSMRRPRPFSTLAASVNGEERGRKE